MRKLASHLVITLLCAALGLTACKGSTENSTSAVTEVPADKPPVGQANTAPPATSKSSEPASARQSGPLRCGDFLSKTEAGLLGLDAQHYNDNENQEDPALGVACSFGQALAVIYHGDQYATIQRGKEEAVKRGALQAEQGASLGSEAHWSTMQGLHTVGFLSSNKLYAALVTSPDKTAAENLARAIDANMQKP